VESLGQELLSDRYVVEQSGGGQTAFVQQVASELGDDPGLGGVGDRWLMRYHNAFLAKHGQQALQSLRIASANPLRSTAMSQKPIHHIAVQSLDINVFLLQPPAEIANDNYLLSDGVVSVALIGYSGCIGIEVFTQRPLAQSFNRA
jgi:hypothetical protein